MFRDESFITSWGGGGWGRLYSGGGSEIFLVMYLGGGVENKLTYGQGGGHVFRQVLGGSDVFHWSFLSLKVIASGGLCPPDPPISQLFNVKLSEPLGGHWK